MPDIDGLKQRIELINARLKTAHVARERESAALSDIWDQIRERYLDQQIEFENMRQQINELEETRDDLTSLIQTLLAAVETNLERASDESVPQIKEMAETLLENNSAEILTRGNEDLLSIDADDTSTETQESLLTNEISGTDDLILAIEESLEDDGTNEVPDIQPGLVEEEKTRGLSENQTAALSPGIRDLIGQIEEGVGPVTMETEEDVSEPAGKLGELSSDLQEIEELRGELMGLRERIASNGS